MARKATARPDLATAVLAVPKYGSAPPRNLGPLATLFAPSIQGA
ncbi:hypothetical protein APY03_5016 [Variovorax sp. WDL1]|nr:hypothetical protein APY03_5016 [Variovorax sp. WDL1]